jgi:hypothetical protein
VGHLPAHIEEKLTRFQGFQDGWAFGEGRRFSRSVVDQTRSLVAFGLSLNVFDTADIFPGRHGQIVASFYCDGHVYDFAIAGDAIRLTHEFNNEDIGDEVALSFEEALHRIIAIGMEPAWHSYVSYSQTNLNRHLEGLRALPSNHRATDLDYLYLNKHAPKDHPVAFAPMPASTIVRQYRQPQKSSTSGNSTRLHSH